MTEAMVEVFSKHGRTVHIRCDLVDDWRKNNVECPDCKGFGHHAVYQGGSLPWASWGWHVWLSYPCKLCNASGFVRPAKEPSHD